MHRIGKEKEELDKENIPHRLLIHIHNIKPDSILPKKIEENILPPTRKSNVWIVSATNMVYIHSINDAVIQAVSFIDTALQCCRY